MVEILAHNLERESSLHRRVDLFFLVDSIAQCSKGLKGKNIMILSESGWLVVLPSLPLCNAREILCFSGNCKGNTLF